MHGGKRAGAGRKRGSASTKPREIADRASAEGITPLEYMLSILRDVKQEDSARFAAAKECAPYIHPRLAAVEHSGEMHLTHESALIELEAAANGDEGHVVPN